MRVTYEAEVPVGNRVKMSDTAETKVVTTDDKDILAAARCLLAGGSDLHCPDCVFRANKDENVFACKQKLFASLQQYIENTNEKCRQFYSSKVVEFPVALHDTIYDSDGQACEVTDLIDSITGDIRFVAKKSDKHSDTFYAKDRGKVWFASIADYDVFKSAKPSRVEAKVESLSGKIWREYIDALGTTYLLEGEIKQIIPRGEGIGDYEVVAYFPATADHPEDSVTAPLSTFILTRDEAVKSLLEEK